MSNKTYSLLVYEMIPEETNMYLIPNELIEENGYRKFLNGVQNLFANVDDMNDGMHFINAALASGDDEGFKEYVEKGFEEYIACLAEFKQDLVSPIVNTTITHVYLTGFVL